MNFQWFKDLLALSETSNFTRAAQRTNTSQSAFSRRIKALEAWVGAPLVDRSSQPVTLTEAGRQMLEAGEQALNRIETERQNIRESLAQPDKYVVTFAAQHSIGWRYFPNWLQSFEEHFGPIMSRLRADDLPNCVADLKRGEVDFVISYESMQAAGVPPAKSIESVRIGGDQLIPVCKPDGEGRALFHLDAPDTGTIPYLRFGSLAPIGWHVEPMLKSRGLMPRLSAVYENSMGGALRVRARDGLGVAWLPRSMVAPDMTSGLLTQAGSDDWAIHVDIRLHRMRSNQNMLIRRIWTFLKLREDVPLISTA